MGADAFADLHQIDVGDVDLVSLPKAAARLVDDAEERIEAFLRKRERDDRRIPAFVASNGRVVYRALARIRALGLAPGPAFCEWGSGFGVATSLAATLDFNAVGIEIEPDLVAEARRLATDHHLPARFVLGNYRPPGTDDETVDPATLGVSLGFPPTGFDLIYAYPWPAEQRAIAYLFGRFARPGALLVTYFGGGHFAVHRRGD